MEGAFLGSWFWVVIPRLHLRTPYCWKNIPNHRNPQFSHVSGFSRLFEEIFSPTVRNTVGRRPFQQPSVCTSAGPTLRDIFLTLVNSRMSSNRNSCISSVFDISVATQPPSIDVRYRMIKKNEAALFDVHIFNAFVNYKSAKFVIYLIFFFGHSWFNRSIFRMWTIEQSDLIFRMWTKWPHFSATL